MRFLRPRGFLCLLMLFFLIFFFAHICPAAENATGPYSKGLANFKQGNFEQALTQFEEAVKTSPDNAKAHYYLGLTLNRLGRNADAALALEKAGELDPTLPGLHLNLGIAYYKLEAFEPALLELNRAIQKDPKDASAHLFMGLTYQGHGQYEKSLTFFEKARNLDPDFNQLSWYYVGIAYYKMGRNDAARGAFKRAVDADPQSDTAKDAQDLLNAMAGKEKGKKRWRIKADAGVEYDDNITIEERDAASEVKDWAAVFEFEGGYKFLDRKPFEGEITYNFYQSVFFESNGHDTSQMNTHSHDLGLSGGVDLGKWDIGLGYDYSFMLLGGDSFLQTHSISPNVGFLPLSILYINLSYSLEIKDFFQEEDEPRDGLNNSGGLDVFLFFLEHKGYVQVGYRLEGEDTSGDEFDYVGHIATCAVQVPLPFQSKVRFSYQYRFKDYLHDTPSIGEEREDNRHTFKVVLTKEIIDHLEVKLDYEHIRSISNLPSADYHENVIYMGVSYGL